MTTYDDAAQFEDEVHADEIPELRAWDVEGRRLDLDFVDGRGHVTASDPEFMELDLLQELLRERLEYWGYAVPRSAPSEEMTWRAVAMFRAVKPLTGWRKLYRGLQNASSGEGGIG